MAELTKEQLDKASTVFWETYTPIGATTWDGLRAAAPYLQLPWDEATEEEANQCRKAFGRHYTTGGREWIRTLNDFIRTRNAKLLPKPVDARRQALRSVLHERVPFPLIEMLIDEAISALDGAQ